VSNSLVRVSSTPVISPHPLAPLYETSPREQQLLLKQAIQEVLGGKLRTTEETRQLLRQSGFVNLWFFCRCIAGYSGPYESLNFDLHLDMANFYQLGLEPGSRFGGFVPRGHYKSSIWTHGANAWEVVRDPNVEIIQASNIIDRSIEFLEYTQGVFTENELFSWLYPEWVPAAEGRVPHWNSKQLQVPCKGRNLSKPNIRIIAVGGSIQGVHSGVFKVDDLVGEHMLDGERNATADMLKAAKWAPPACENIPKVAKRDRIFFTGTRYGPEDGYTWMWEDIKGFYGYLNGEPFEIQKDGNWTMYYRAVREDWGFPDPEGREHIIMPEKWTHKEIDKIREKDPWQYWTQMMNMSTYSGLSEFIDFKPKECSLDIGENRDWYVEIPNGGKPIFRNLADMDIVIACDPAASERKQSTRTSRSAVVVLARDWEDHIHLLEVRTGYVPVTTVFDWLFALHKKFRARCTVMEAQGPFKVLEPIMREEQMRRNHVLNLRPVPAKGDKDARIRSNLTPPLEGGRFYATEQAGNLMEEEMIAFPGGKKKDVLDAVSLGVFYSYKPEPPDDEDEDDRTRKARQRRRGRSPVTGY
jgi:hypothetical protein